MYFFFKTTVLYPVFLYNFTVRSFSYARVENQKLVVEKVTKRETWSAELRPSVVDRWVL